VQWPVVERRKEEEKKKYKSAQDGPMVKSQQQNKPQPKQHLPS
jgi:hypothetical protein